MCIYISQCNYKAKYDYTKYNAKKIIIILQVKMLHIVTFYPL